MSSAASMRPRAFWSGRRRRSLMLGKLPVRPEHVIGVVFDLLLRAGIDVAPARASHLAVLAVVLVCGMDEEAPAHDVEQVAEHILEACRPGTFPRMRPPGTNPSCSR